MADNLGAEGDEETDLIALRQAVLKTINKPKSRTFIPRDEEEDLESLRLAALQSKRKVIGSDDVASIVPRKDSNASSVPARFSRIDDSDASEAESLESLLQEPEIELDAPDDSQLQSFQKPEPELPKSDLRKVVLKQDGSGFENFVIRVAATSTAPAVVSDEEEEVERRVVSVTNKPRIVSENVVTSTTPLNERTDESNNSKRKKIRINRASSRVDAPSEKVEKSSSVQTSTPSENVSDSSLRARLGDRKPDLKSRLGQREVQVNERSVEAKEAKSIFSHEKRLSRDNEDMHRTDRPREVRYTSEVKHISKPRTSMHEDISDNPRTQSRREVRDSQHNRSEHQAINREQSRPESSDALRTDRRRNSGEERRNVRRENKFVRNEPTSENSHNKCDQIGDRKRDRDQENSVSDVRDYIKHYNHDRGKETNSNTIHKEKQVNIERTSSSETSREKHKREIERVGNREKNKFNRDEKNGDEPVKTSVGNEKRTIRVSNHDKEKSRNVNKVLEGAINDKESRTVKSQTVTDDGRMKLSLPSKPEVKSNDSQRKELKTRDALLEERKQKMAEKIKTPKVELLPKPDDSESRKVDNKPASKKTETNVSENSKSSEIQSHDSKSSEMKPEPTESVVKSKRTSVDAVDDNVKKTKDDESQKSTADADEQNEEKGDAGDLRALLNQRKALERKLEALDRMESKAISPDSSVDKINEEKTVDKPKMKNSVIQTDMERTETVDAVKPRSKSQIDSEQKDVKKVKKRKSQSTESEKIPAKIKKSDDSKETKAVVKKETVKLDKKPKTVGKPTKPVNKADELAKVRKVRKALQEEAKRKLEKIEPVTAKKKKIRQSRSSSSSDSESEKKKKKKKRVTKTKKKKTRKRKESSSESESSSSTSSSSSSSSSDSEESDDSAWRFKRAKKTDNSSPKRRRSRSSDRRPSQRDSRRESEKHRPSSRESRTESKRPRRPYYDQHDHRGDQHDHRDRVDRYDQNDNRGGHGHKNRPDRNRTNQRDDRSFGRPGHKDPRPGDHRNKDEAFNSGRVFGMGSGDKVEAKLSELWPLGKKNKAKSKARSGWSTDDDDDVKLTSRSRGGGDNRRRR